MTERPEEKIPQGYFLVTEYKLDTEYKNEKYVPKIMDIKEIIYVAKPIYAGFVKITLINQEIVTVKETFEEIMQRIQEAE